MPFIHFSLLNYFIPTGRHLTAKDPNTEILINSIEAKIKTIILKAIKVASENNVKNVGLNEYPPAHHKTYIFTKSVRLLFKSVAPIGYKLDRKFCGYLSTQIIEEISLNCGDTEPIYVEKNTKFMTFDEWEKFADE